VFRRVATAVLAEAVSTAAPLTHFLRATLDVDDAGRLAARLTGGQGSNLLTSMARADALLVIPEEMSELPAGAAVRAMLLGDEALDTERAPA
jgi:molybdopterin molybdotransferase